MWTAEWIAEKEGNTKAGFGRFLDTLTEKQKEVRVGLPYLILSLILSQEKITALVRHDLVLSITLTSFTSVHRNANTTTNRRKIGSPTGGMYH